MDVVVEPSDAPPAEGQWNSDAGGHEALRSAEAEQEVHLSGSRIIFTWDYGVSVPLWDETGLLPEEPEWLERELGLSRGLVSELVAWTNALEAALPGRLTEALSQEEERLVQRVKEELTPGLTVVWEP